MNKICKDCKETKPVGEFYRSSSGYGYQSYCKPCNTARALSSSRRSRYGVTQVELEQLIAPGVCDSCGDTVGGGGQHIDHCHTTGRVRGVLCRGCNLAIGHAGDSPDRLRALAAYLDRFASSKLSMMADQ